MSSVFHESDNESFNERSDSRHKNKVKCHTLQNYLLFASRRTLNYYFFSLCNSSYLKSSRYYVYHWNKWTLAQNLLALHTTPCTNKLKSVPHAKYFFKQIGTKRVMLVSSTKFLLRITRLFATSAPLSNVRSLSLSLSFDTILSGVRCLSIEKWIQDWDRLKQRVSYNEISLW